MRTIVLLAVGAVVFVALYVGTGAVYVLSSSLVPGVVTAAAYGLTVAIIFCAAGYVTGNMLGDFFALLPARTPLIAFLLKGSMYAACIAILSGVVCVAVMMCSLASRFLCVRAGLPAMYATGGMETQFWMAFTFVIAYGLSGALTLFLADQA